MANPIKWIGGLKDKFSSGTPRTIKDTSGNVLSEEQVKAHDEGNAEALRSPEYAEVLKDSKKGGLSKLVASPEETREILESNDRYEQMKKRSIKAAEKGMVGMGIGVPVAKALNKAGIIPDEGMDDTGITNSKDMVRAGLEKTGELHYLDGPEEETETESASSEIADATGNEPEVIESQMKQATQTPEGRYKVGSIMDAYRNGQITKDERNYFLVDALATFGSNMADQFGKYASAYSGGSYTPENKASQWQNRNESLAERGIQSEVNQAGSEDLFDLDYMSRKLGVDSKRLSNETQKINNLNLNDKRIMAKQILNDYKSNKKLTQMEKIRLASVYNSLLGSGQVSPQDSLLLQIGDLVHSVF